MRKGKFNKCTNLLSLEEGVCMCVTETTEKSFDLLQLIILSMNAAHTTIS